MALSIGLEMDPVTRNSKSSVIMKSTTIPLAVVGSLSNPSPSGQADARDFSLRAHSLRTSIVAPKSFSADLSGRVRLRSGIVPPNAPTQRFALSALGILDTDRGVSPCGPH